MSPFRKLDYERDRRRDRDGDEPCRYSTGNDNTAGHVITLGRFTKAMWWRAMRGSPQHHAITHRNEETHNGFKHVPGIMHVGSFEDCKRRSPVVFHRPNSSFIPSRKRVAYRFSLLEAGVRTIYDIHLVHNNPYPLLPTLTLLPKYIWYTVV